MMAFRNSYKTTTITVSEPIRLLMNDPDLRICIMGPERGYAIHILGLIKTSMEENQMLIEINGGSFRGPSGWKDYEIWINGRKDFTAKEPSIATAGMDKFKAGPKFDYLFIDDPETDENIRGIELCEKLVERYQRLTPLLRRPTIRKPWAGRMFIAGTPWSPSGPYYYILGNAAESKQFRFLFGQAVKRSALLATPVCDEPPIILPKGPDGTYCMPKTTTPEFLEIEEAKDPIFFAGQYLVSMIGGETAEFDRDWFSYYTKDLLPFDLTYYLAVDPAISEKRTADFTCLMVAAQDVMDNLYIIKVVNERMNPDQLIEWCYRLYNRYHPRRVGIETNGFQKLLKRDLDREGRIRGKLPVQALPHYGKQTKKVRIRSLIKPYRNSRIYHLALNQRDCELGHVAPEQRIVESELLFWDPDGTTKNDVPDTMAMIFEMMRRPRSVHAPSSSTYRPADRKTGY